MHIVRSKAVALLQTRQSRELEKMSRLDCDSALSLVIIVGILKTHRQNKSRSVGGGKADGTRRQKTYQASPSTCRGQDKLFS
jgi:hypothetical protein